MKNDEPADIKPHEMEAAKAVKGILEEDITRHYTLKQLSMKAGINECTLKRVFKRLYASTIHQYLIGLRLEHGHHLIVSTGDSLGDIANACGYENASHFYRLFRKKYKTDPGALRQRIFPESPNQRTPG